MAAPMLSRALRPTIAPYDPSAFICLACRRQQSSFRRQRKALRVKPDASFAPSKTETQDHIIFNPPSSAPNIYHTPAKFLPKTDPRWTLHSLATLQSSPSSSLASTTTSNPSTRTSIPPNPQFSGPQNLKPIRAPYTKKYHLTQPEIDEMRALRAADPRTWTRTKLAEKFECSPFFVSLCCGSQEAKERHERELDAIKRRWGRTKTEAREERVVRKALWGRDA